VVGAVSVLPYVLSLAPGLDQAESRLRVPSFVVILLSIAQSAFMLGLMTFAGLWAAGKLGMGAPWLDAWTSGRSAPRGFRSSALLSAGLVSPQGSR